MPKRAPSKKSLASTKRTSTAKKTSPPELPPLTATTHTLDNGLDLIIREDHEHPLASVQIWVRAGSLHEEGWIGAGLAHCVEHMLFKGTEKRNAAQISQSIQDLGGYVNAYTSFNRTVYWIDGLADHVDGYLEILSDMVRHSQIDAAELAREQDVIRREMAMDNDDPGSTAQHLMQATAFKKHPLRHPIIGYRQVFDQISRAEVAGFISRHYIPNNCFVVIAGAVDPAAVIESAEKYLGSWQRRPYEPVMLPEEPRQRGRREARKDFPTELAHVSCGWQIPGESHPDKAALDVLGFLLGSGRSSRLYQTLREKQGLAHFVWAGTHCAEECGLFLVDVECDPADAAAAQAGMEAVVQQMRVKPPARSDLDKAVRATLSGQLRSLATTKGQAASLGGSWLLTGGLELSQQYLGTVRALTPAAILDVAQRYLLPETASIVHVGPKQEKKTAATRNVRSQPKARRLELPNGLKLLIQPQDRLPLVSIRAQFLAGVPVETPETGGVTQMSAQLLLKGTKTRAAAEIASELESLGGALHCAGDAQRYYLGADVMRGDEGTALDLVSDLILNPLLPAAQLTEIKKRQIASIREEREDPLTVALRRARAEIFAGQAFARTALGTEESVGGVGIAQCRAALKTGFVGGNGTLAIVGDVDPDEICKQALKVFRTLKKGPRQIDPKMTLTSNAKAGRWEQKLEKEQAALVIGFPTVGFHHADSYTLKLIDEACSDMGSRLFNRIREELGLAYYVGAQAFHVTGCGAFYFYVGTDPAKLDQAEAEMLRLIKDLAKDGLDSAELQRAKSTWRTSWLRSQQGTAGIADMLSWNELVGHGWQHHQKLPGIMETIGLQEVRRVTRAYFKQKPFVVRVTP